VGIKGEERAVKGQAGQERGGELSAKKNHSRNEELRGKEKESRLEKEEVAWKKKKVFDAPCSASR